MSTFFMSHWDDASRVTKFYICDGEEWLGNYQITTLPLFVLTDDVAQTREAQNLIGALWEECNIFCTPVGRPEGDQFFTATRDVFGLLGSLKQVIGNHRAARRAGVAVPAPAPGEWGSMSHLAEAVGNAGEAINSWVDAASTIAGGDGRIAIDFETNQVPEQLRSGGGGSAAEGLVLRDPNRQTLRVPGDVAFRAVGGGGGGYASGGQVSGGGGSAAEYGTMVHAQFGVPSNDLSIQVVEREVNMGQQARRRVRVTTADGRVHRMSLREYERRINTGRLVSLNGV